MSGTHVASIGRMMVNEIGNTIDIQVRLIQHGGAKHDEVRIIARGPHSKVDHLWTKKEARVLMHLLTEMLT